MAKLAAVADSFIYVVSVAGVTGQRKTVNDQLPALIDRIKSHTTLPLAIGFGVSTREQFKYIGSLAEGVVIGSALINVLEANGVNSLGSTLSVQI